MVLKQLNKGEHVNDSQCIMNLPESTVRTIWSDSNVICESVQSCMNLSIA